MNFRVEQKSGEKITLEASQNCTVGSLKHKLFELTRVEQNKQRLFYEVLFLLNFYEIIRLILLFPHFLGH